MNKMLVLAAALAALLAGFLVGDPFSGGRILAAVMVGLPWLVYIAATRPRIIYGALALALSMLPFGVVPGTPLPLVLLLAVSAALAAVLRPRRPGARIPAMAWCIIVLMTVGGISMAVTYVGSFDLAEFAKWLIATSAGLSVLRLDRPERAAFGRLFVYGSVAAAVFGLFGVLVDKSGQAMRLLSIFGYQSGESTLRFVFGSTEQSTRLTGTYVDPNAGGLFLYVALFLALAMLRGPRLVIAGGILATALTLTLSRAAIFSAVVALLVFFAFQSMRLSGRIKTLGVGAAASAALFAVPEVQNRIFDSFGNSDAGSSARSEALANFPGHMEGHWLFGLGWGRIEFRDAEAGFLVNHVANAPLLSIYRGGLVTGLVFCTLLIVGLVLAVKGLRGADTAAGYVGAAFIGLVLVALQLDFPVVTIPPVATLFAVLLGFLPRSEDFPIKDKVSMELTIVPAPRRLVKVPA
ncbi:hypothetical protein [Arthrobacter cavernae]|uniref:O-antigen ligase domain-containing protein n=1 Tax=Arthrobacter cavernae TaxID=2817681 RepID=A0A939HHR8_9MICC|nr:hypothetical protein [Arthrobacter cavernae]MBO1267710.1 hypothetical protein [Arthrobacter cavernae]